MKQQRTKKKMGRGRKHNKTRDDDQDVPGGRDDEGEKKKRDAQSSVLNV